MNQQNPVFINWTLVKEFDLSEKALLAYLAILKSCKLTPYQAISSLSLVKNLFGVEAKNTMMLRQGLDELIEKEVIQISYREKRAVFYDLTLLDKYEGDLFIKEDFSFFGRFEDLGVNVCNLYLLYILIKATLETLKSNGAGVVLATYKKDLAESLKCSRYVVGDRLEELKKFGFITYEDYSQCSALGMNGNPSLFITLPEFEEEILKKVKGTISNKYLKKILSLEELEEENDFASEEIFEEILDEEAPEMEEKEEILNNGESPEAEESEIEIVIRFKKGGF